MINSINANAAAASKHRTMLVAAWAVEVLRGCKSTSKVFNVVNVACIEAEKTNCKTSGIAICYYNQLFPEI
jgi:hypothetical protein